MIICERFISTFNCLKICKVRKFNIYYVPDLLTVAGGCRAGTLDLCFSVIQTRGFVIPGQCQVLYPRVVLN